LTAQRRPIIVAGMSIASFSNPPSDRDPDFVARASSSVTVLTLEELARRMQSLQPPAAYRLSLDSGLEYQNVRRAIERPLTVRLDTWLKLSRSLRIRMVAAACAEDVIWPGEQTLLVAFGTDATALVAPASTTSLRSCRIQRGWSRRELARRAGVSVDAVGSVENGRGLMCKLVRICEAFGLQLLLALPPWHASLEALWTERAARCLQHPAQYPASRPTRR
jgi:DNA-binding XRE family transcriptional regulator